MTSARTLCTWGGVETCCEALGRPQDPEGQPPSGVAPASLNAASVFQTLLGNLSGFKDEAQQKRRKLDGNEGAPPERPTASGGAGKDGRQQNNLERVRGLP